MPIQSAFARQRHDFIAPLNVPRIVPDEPGGWFVVTGNNKFGWLYGSRHEALAAQRELAAELR